MIDAGITRALAPVERRRLPQCPTIGAFGDLRHVETLGIMLDDKDAQRTVDSGQVAPQAEIGLKLTDVADTIGQKQLQAIARHDQKTPDRVGLLHGQKQLVKGAVTRRDIARLPLEGDPPIRRGFQRVKVFGAQDAGADIGKTLGHPASRMQGPDAGHLDQFDPVALSTLLTALRINGEATRPVRPVCGSYGLLHIDPGLL